MNVNTNLPEPTYRFQKLIIGFKDTMRLLKNIALLTKKVLML